jgi:putative membrane protein
VTTFSPAFADDIEYAVGLSSAAEARSGGLDDVLLVDAHNCNDGLAGENLGHVVPGSQRSFDVIRGAGEVGDRLARADQHPLEAGVAWDETPWGPRDGIGPLGIRVAVFDVAGQRTAYVLVDGNNMEPGLREAIVDAVDRVDRLEVMTTDTHVVNTVEADNQVGGAVPAEELIALIDDLVVEAIADLEPVEAGVESETAQVTVFGNDRTEMLASTANAAISLGGPLAAAIILAALSVSAVIFLLASI